MARCISIAKVVILFAMMQVFLGILALAAYNQYFLISFEDFRFYVLIGTNVEMFTNILLSASLYFVLKEENTKQGQDIDEGLLKKLSIQPEPSILPGLPHYLPCAPPYSEEP